MDIHHSDDPTSALQDMCANDELPFAKGVVVGENVVMNEDGTLTYSNGEKRIDIKRKRKELVLGLNGFEQHSLSEANEILDTSSHSPWCLLRSLFTGRNI